MSNTRPNLRGRGRAPSIGRFMQDTHASRARKQPVEVTPRSFKRSSSLPIQANNPIRAPRKKNVITPVKQDTRQIAPKEVLQYAHQIGLDPDKDHDLLWIAYEGAAAPLPPGWACRQTTPDSRFYVNEETGETSGEHPMTSYYHALYYTHKIKHQVATDPDLMPVDAHNELGTENTPKKATHSPTPSKGYCTSPSNNNSSSRGRRHSSAPLVTQSPSNKRRGSLTGSTGSGGGPTTPTKNSNLHGRSRSLSPGSPARQGTRNRSISPPATRTPTRRNSFTTFESPEKLSSPLTNGGRTATPPKQRGGRCSQPLSPPFRGQREQNQNSSPSQRKTMGHNTSQQSSCSFTSSTSRTASSKYCSSTYPWSEHTTPDHSYQRHTASSSAHHNPHQVPQTATSPPTPSGGVGGCSPSSSVPSPAGSQSTPTLAQGCQATHHHQRAVGTLQTSDTVLTADGQSSTLSVSPLTLSEPSGNSSSSDVDTPYHTNTNSRPSRKLRRRSNGQTAQQQQQVTLLNPLLRPGSQHADNHHHPKLDDATSKKVKLLEQQVQQLQDIIAQQAEMLKKKDTSINSLLSMLRGDTPTAQQQQLSAATIIPATTIAPTAVAPAHMVAPPSPTYTPTPVTPTTTYIAPTSTTDSSTTHMTTTTTSAAAGGGGSSSTPHIYTDYSTTNNSIPHIPLIPTPVVPTVTAATTDIGTTTTTGRGQCGQTATAPTVARAGSPVVVGSATTTPTKQCGVAVGCEATPESRTAYPDFATAYLTEQARQCMAVLQEETQTPAGTAMDNMATVISTCSTPTRLNSGSPCPSVGSCHSSSSKGIGRTNPQVLLSCALQTPTFMHQTGAVPTTPPSAGGTTAERQQQSSSSNGHHHQQQYQYHHHQQLQHHPYQVGGISNNNNNINKGALASSLTSSPSSSPPPITLPTSNGPILPNSPTDLITCVLPATATLIPSEGILPPPTTLVVVNEEQASQHGGSSADTNSVVIETVHSATNTSRRSTPVPVACTDANHSHNNKHGGENHPPPAAARQQQNVDGLLGPVMASLSSELINESINHCVDKMVNEVMVDTWRQTQSVVSGQVAQLVHATGELEERLATLELKEQSLEIFGTPTMF